MFRVRARAKGRFGRRHTSPVAQVDRAELVARNAFLDRLDYEGNYIVVLRESEWDRLREMVREEIASWGTAA